MNNSDLPIQPNSTSNDPYSFVEHRHPGQPPTVVVGDPCLENPCSYEAVKTVLHKLLRTTGVGIDRKWTVLGCDGFLYLLGSRILEKK